MKRDRTPLSPHGTSKDLNDERIKFRYELEQRVMDAIAHGNYTLIREAVEQDASSFLFNPIVRRIPDNELRDRGSAKRVYE
ncbi:hypothetical protein [Atopococcus tabaci]|uniref:hypothetical protein n=1 Tax=Atopococcus tabaci TaxID=269774 RepID=UPI002408FE92|nr:hypothetical protein [Atopococcus tabaci]